jgi:hypothetical protein
MQKINVPGGKTHEQGLVWPQPFGSARFRATVGSSSTHDNLRSAAAAVAVARSHYCPRLPLFCSSTLARATNRYCAEKGVRDGRSHHSGLKIMNRQSHDAYIEAEFHRPFLLLSIGRE